MRSVNVVLAAPLILCFGWLAAAHSQEARERVDMDMVRKIRDEGLNRSQAMDTISYLTDVHGPRLTGSPLTRRAGEWTRDKLTEWKLENSHLEPWGPFGRGWTLERFAVNMVEPSYAPLIAYPKAWTTSTQKVVRGKPIYLDVKNEADLEKYRGKLNKAIVLISPPVTVRAQFDPPARRQTDTNLLNLSNSDPGGRRGAAPPPQPTAQAGRGARGNAQPAEPQRGNQQESRSASLMQNSKWQMVHDEGAAAVLEPGRGTGGTVFVFSATLPPRAAPAADGAARSGGARRAWSPDAPPVVPQAVVAVEHYNRLIRMLERGAPVELEVDILSQFHSDDLNSFNVIAEIPGTDLKDEVVMLGGHFDSFHTGTGATDNAIGCGVALEAVRILQAIGAKPRRTIRIGLWTGEEQGLLGSRAYVTEHFGRAGGGNRPANPPAASGGAADGATAATNVAQPGAGRVELKPEHEKFAAYFNLDNGGGKIRGIYLQGNEAARPIFRAWLAPFSDLGASTIAPGNTGGTDHQSFDGVGLPGFQFIQDPLEYDSRTHHSSQDVFDRLIEDDVKQASVIMASFVYNAAMRDEKLPRKPLPGRSSSSSETPSTPAGATPPVAATPDAQSETAPANPVE